MVILLEHAYALRSGSNIQHTNKHTMNISIMFGYESKWTYLRIDVGLVNFKPYISRRFARVKIDPMQTTTKWAFAIRTPPQIVDVDDDWRSYDLFTFTNDACQGRFDM